MVYPVQAPFQNPYRRYREQSIQTASPGKLIIMLYDGLVSSLSQAGEAIRDGRIEEAHNKLIKSQDIILELDASLNMEFEISRHLHAVYDFLYRQAVKANVDKDFKIAESCLVMARELRDAWLQAANSQVGSTLASSADAK
ncbi:flagellar export chaperone FliS [Desulfotomaculum copahuensis]|uniref:Flagellar secretion chaperone FliS n=1 Tax=Desulfotomaculum copahuensis TaxID=1838280 RepID=A0A1B7LCB8_9FIRM|nr:flagellar export chaperone FliS [Desulfotomaculum copahuensis]OAT80379.1 flagellar export chaperone FliS [Desulfotomaculum copahuensis]